MLAERIFNKLDVPISRSSKGTRECHPLADREKTKRILP